MSAIAFLQKMLAAGLPLDLAMKAAAAFEEETAAPEISETPRQARNRRYYEARRLKASETVLPASEQDVSGVRSPPPAPSPRPPTPPTPTRDISTQARGADFSTFWAAYPRKVGKPNAEKAYAKALARISGPDPPSLVLAGLSAHLPAWLQIEPDKIPHPTTWLARDGWNDQPPIPRPKVHAIQPSSKFAAKQANLDRAFAGAESAARARAQR